MTDTNDDKKWFVKVVLTVSVERNRPKARTLALLDDVKVSML